MDGRMVPRWIMLFVFRLCLLRISMIHAMACMSVIVHLPFQQLLRNTCLGAILWMHWGNYPRVWSLDSFLKGEALANFWGKLDLDITNSTGMVPCSLGGLLRLVLPKNERKVL